MSTSCYSFYVDNKNSSYVKCAQCEFLYDSDTFNVSLENLYSEALVSDWICPYCKSIGTSPCKPDNCNNNIPTEVDRDKGNSNITAETQTNRRDLCPPLLPAVPKIEPEKAPEKKAPEKKESKKHTPVSQLKPNSKPKGSFKNLLKKCTFKSDIKQVKRDLNNLTQRVSNLERTLCLVCKSLEDKDLEICQLQSSIKCLYRRITVHEDAMLRKVMETICTNLENSDESLANSRQERSTETKIALLLKKNYVPNIG